jgi:predicted phosphodiesterase
MLLSLPKSYAAHGMAAGLAGLTPSPTPSVPIGSGNDVPAQTEGEPIHMPDLVGQSLDYATSIWDEDEPLPQIVVEPLSDGPNLVVVGQTPAAGTWIIPAQTRIVLTLGPGPVTRPSPSPTPEPRFSAAVAVAGQATLLRAPYVQNLKTTAVTIVWTTVEDGPSEVQYGIGDYSLTAPATSTFFTTPAAAPYDQYYVHEATLTGLTPDTAYQYKIFTNSVDLTPGGSVPLRTAKPSTTTPFRFAALGDSGDGSQNQKDVATRLLQVQPDLVVHTGDMIYPEATYDGLETKFFQIYKDLIKSAWFAPTMGNHDVTYNNGKSFTDVFVNPPNGTSQNELYYSFDYGNAHFVVLNNYFSMNTVGSLQYNWLAADLAASTQFWKFVFFHVPAYASNSQQQPHDDAKTVQNLVPLFEQYGVDLVFSGHWHYYERMKPLLGGQVSTIEAGGVVYLVTGGGGAGLAGVGTGTLNPRTAAKVQKFHLTMMDVNGCSLQLSAVQKVSGSADTFDASDIFDQYTIDRCGGTPTSTPTATATATDTPTPTATATDGPSPTFTQTATTTATPTPTDTATPTETPIPTHTTMPTPTSTETATLTRAETLKLLYLPVILNENPK